MPNPVARSQGLLVEELGEDLIICDVERDVVHSLNGPAAACWKALDGTNNISELAALIYPEMPQAAAVQLARFALKTLDEKHLLVQTVPTGVINRRDCLNLLRQHSMKAAGVLVAITTIASPSPSAAQSMLPDGSGCGESSQCASGCCSENVNLCCASSDQSDCTDASFGSCL